MKSIKKIFFTLIFLNILFSNISYSQQDSVLKTHLFLGTWVMKPDKDAKGTLIEIWKVDNENVISGKDLFIDKGDTTLFEKLRLTFVDGVLTYGASVIDQNEGKEILFQLKSTDENGKKFIFENLNHDFPKRIIYDFTLYNGMKAQIEDDNESMVFTFYRDYRIDEIFELKGIILKEEFVNKANRKIEGVYDYFFEIEREKYFIKMSKGNVSKEKLDLFIDKEVKMKIMIINGLWDADDNNVQSRIGKYVIPISIVE